MPLREWTPVALLAQVTGWYHRHNGWPTVKDLALYTDLPADKVQELLAALIDRRLVKVEDETIYPWEAGPSPVTTYKWSPEEIAARYGPPNRPAERVAAQKEAAKEIIGRWPEQPTETTEEADEMPKGTDINWPDDARLVAMANEIASRGGNVVEELARQFECSKLTVIKKLRAARRALLAAAIGQSEAGPAAESALAPAPETEPGPTPEPTPGELMQEAEIEANTIAAEVANSPTEAAAVLPEPPEESASTSVPSMPETGLSEAQIVSAPEALQTFRTLVLVEQPDPEHPPMTRRELEHVSRAPDNPGDDWAELVRVDGRKTYRMWTCVAMLDNDICIMIPSGAVLVTRTPAELRTA